MILEDMCIKYQLLVYIKECLILKGQSRKRLSYISGQIDLLSKLIKKESNDVLDGILRQKTYYRLFNKIEQGAENLIDIINNPNEWKIYDAENHLNEWSNKDALIFSTQKGLFVFTKNDYEDGQKYVDNKWQ
jgi:hypothetical protein